MNRIDQAFEDKKDHLLNVYYTAGFPSLNDTLRIAGDLEESGADIIELGMPYSDPIADGPTIQDSSNRALENGMNIDLLFSQLETLRPLVTIPVILMGYLNPVMQFGIDKFCQRCNDVGIDGLIIPDLPMKDYLEVYKEIFQAYGIYNIFLITPQTADDRIRTIDENTDGFIYEVASSSITGAKNEITESQITYFSRIRNMELSSRLMIGFGISNHETFVKACDYADGAIIGSAFIRLLEEDPSSASIQSFIRDIKQTGR